MFNDQRIECPVCPKRKTKRGSFGVQLELVEHNYSGCGVDIASCPNCQRVFEISYKVDKIKDISDAGW